MVSQPGRTRAYLALIAGILCIAWSAIFVRWTSVPGTASAFYRLLIPAIVLLPTWLLPAKPARLSARSYAIIAIGGFFFALDLAFYNTSILRPWYVLGPGRRWPVLLKPLYALLGLLPQTRASATRLGLVTNEQMNAALVNAVEAPANGVRIVEVPQIRQSRL